MKSFVFALCFAACAFAGAEVSKKGNVTGGTCKTDVDCLQGCIGAADPTCLAKSEGSSKCLENKSPPPGGLKCGCLTDVKKCGFQFPIQK